MLSAPTLVKKCSPTRDATPKIWHKLWCSFQIKESTSTSAKKHGLPPSSTLSQGVNAKYISNYQSPTDTLPFMVLNTGRQETKEGTRTIIQKDWAAWIKEEPGRTTLEDLLLAKRTMELFILETISRPTWKSQEWESPRHKHSCKFKMRGRQKRVRINDIRSIMTILLILCTSFTDHFSLLEGLIVVPCFSGKLRLSWPFTPRFILVMVISDLVESFLPLLWVFLVLLAPRFFFTKIFIFILFFKFIFLVRPKLFIVFVFFVDLWFVLILFSVFLCIQRSFDIIAVVFLTHAEISYVIGIESVHFLFDDPEYVAIYSSANSSISVVCFFLKLLWMADLWVRYFWMYV